jgi:hypothetical protein
VADQNVVRAFRKAIRVRHAGARPAKALFEAGITESGLRNLNYGDRDSQGALQQRASTGWKHATDPYRAALDFLAQAQPINQRGFHGSAGQLAQAVQRSAFPGRYDQNASQAQKFLQGQQGINGINGSTTTTTRTTGLSPDALQGRRALLAQFVLGNGNDPVRPDPDHHEGQDEWWNLERAFRSFGCGRQLQGDLREGRVDQRQAPAIQVGWRPRPDPREAWCASGLLRRRLSRPRRLTQGGRPVQVLRAGRTWAQRHDLRSEGRPPRPDGDQRALLGDVGHQPRRRCRLDPPLGDLVAVPLGLRCSPSARHVKGSTMAEIQADD